MCMIKTSLSCSERTRTNHLLLTDRSPREPVSIPKVSATRSSRFVAHLQYPAFVEEAWNNVEDVISGVDAVAPRSTPSPRIPSYRRQKGGTGGSVSGEDHLDAFFGCLSNVQFHQLLTMMNTGDKAYFYENIYEKVPLEAVPYSEEYGEYLGRASEYLKEVITFFFLVFICLSSWQMKIICLNVLLTRQQTRLKILHWLNS